MVYTKDDVKSISTYLKSEQKEGYSIPQLRKFLVNKGYEKELVDEAIDSLYSSHWNLTDSNKKIVFFVVIMLAFSGLVVLGYLLLFNGSNNINIPDNNNNIGTEIDFTNGDSQSNKSQDNNGKSEGSTTSTTTSTNDQTLPSTNTNSIDNRETKVKSCYEIEDISRKDQCYLSDAYTSGKFELCGKITNTGKQNLCRSMGRARDNLNSDSLALDFSSGEVKPSNQIQGDSILINDYVNLEVEVVEES